MTYWIPFRWLVRISNTVYQEARKASKYNHHSSGPALDYPKAMSMSMPSVDMTGAVLIV